MQTIRSFIAAFLIGSGMNQAAMADCAVIEQLDKLQILQSRLAANPDTSLFRNDIRQLRAIIGGLSEREAVQAVDGNTLVGTGADVVRFLRQTQGLLQRVSMDDPFSVQRHFNAGVRRDLSAMAGHLRDLRCSDEQIEIAQAAAAENPINSSSDAEDLEAVSAAVSQLVDEILDPRNLVPLIVAGAGVAVMTPFIQRWLLLRRRRAKRHNANHPTRYDYDGTRASGALIDINCYGTKLRHAGDTPLQKGAVLNLQIEGIETPGTIMWSNTHYSGVQFKSIISLAQVDFVRRTE